VAFNLLILNGPNLNLLGEREPEIYGSTTLEAIEKSCREYADILDVDLDFFQSNHEGVLVDRIQEARNSTDALVINPAGCSFHSIPVLDALKIYPGPVIELHISNIHARDELHRHSILSGAATGVICGLGAYGYIVAMQTAVQMAGEIPDMLPPAVRFGPG
jgi:3-dehydroquinate dehydratase II